MYGDRVGIVMGNGERPNKTIGMTRHTTNDDK